MSNLKTSQLRHPPMTTREYLRVLRPLLPPEAFKRRLWIPLAQILFHVLLLVAALAAAHFYALSLIAKVALGTLMGHSIACMGLLAHDVSHGSVVKHRGIRYALEMVLWTPFMNPPTVWRRTHNDVHHSHMNTPLDSDRLFLVSERNIFASLYNKLFVPAGNPVRWNPLVFGQFNVGAIGLTLGALLFGWKPINPPVPPLPFYGSKRLLWVFLELIPIVFYQYIIWRVCGGQFTGWLLLGVWPALVGSAVGSMYILTNHMLSPVTDEVDPVQGSTSVVVPAAFNGLHSNFSYHTEHHLFPGINSYYYPLVSKLLQEHFPERYNRITLWQAWRQIWSRAPYVEVQRMPNVEEPASPSAPASNQAQPS